MNTKVDFPKTAYPISNDVLTALEQFEQQELSWLSGYCAGLAKGRESKVFARDTIGSEANTGSGSAVNQSLANVNAQTKITSVQILYASQTGNAQSVAENLFNALKDNHGSSLTLELALENVNNFKVKNLSKKQLIIFIASTHGEGEPPDDAIEFIELLGSKRAPKLSDSQHAVLGLGDSSYEFFCQTGKDLEQLLVNLGSTPLVERVDCDLEFEVPVGQWINDLNQKLSQLVNSEVASHERSVSLPSESSQLASGIVSKTSGVNKLNPFAATILANQKITASDADKTVHHIELSIEDSGIQYLPGDGVGVWAKNDVNTVNEILKLTGLSNNESVYFKEQQYNLYTLLHERLELSLVNKELLKNYYEIAKLTDLVNAEKLLDVLTHSYSDFIKHNQIADVFALVPTQLEAQQLVDLLKPIKPRVYSIASSQQANPDEIHITVKLVINQNDKAIRKGTASRFLIEELKDDQEVMIYIEENPRFRLPESNKDILMVGPGTGIAPFRAFLQEREEQDASGKNWLFFGNSHFNSEFLYQLELQSYLKSGLLSELSLAFSRDQAEKIYVQHKMQENAAAIWQWLDQNQAHFYVCGDMNFMAKDVEQTLLDIIQSQGELTEQQASDYLKDLRKNGRYQRDVY